MSTHEQFPTSEDWKDLWDESQSDARNPRGIARPQPTNTEIPVKPDWDALLDD